MSEEEEEEIGTGADNIENILLFKEWLILNGGKFDKIEWPSLETV